MAYRVGLPRGSRNASASRGRPPLTSLFSPPGPGERLGKMRNHYSLQTKDSRGSLGIIRESTWQRRLASPSIVPCGHGGRSDVTGRRARIATTAKKTAIRRVHASSVTREFGSRERGGGGGGRARCQYLLGSSGSR